MGSSANASTPETLWDSHSPASAGDLSLFSLLSAFPFAPLGQTADDQDMNWNLVGINTDLDMALPRTIENDVLEFRAHSPRVGQEVLELAAGEWSRQSTGHTTAVDFL